MSDVVMSHRRLCHYLLTLFVFLLFGGSHLSYGFCRLDPTKGWISGPSSVAGEFSTVRKSSAGSLFQHGGGYEFYNISSNVLYKDWVVVSGNATLGKIPFSLSKPSTFSMPPSRFGAASWMENGQFAVSGGLGVNSVNVTYVFGDVWSSSGNGNWTLIYPALNSGPFSGILGVYDALDVIRPGSFAFAYSAQYAAQAFYLFGGLFLSSVPSNHFALSNNVFVRRNGSWTYLSGSAAVGDVPDQFGTATFPGGRMKGCMWATANGFWIFGGQKIDPTGGLALTNELWKFTENPILWTYYDMSGRTRVTQLNTYSTSFAPDPRYGCTCWADSFGQFWMYGGRDSQGHLLGDIWSFDPQTLQWAMWWPGGTADQSYFNLPGSPTPAIGSRYGASSVFDPRSSTVTILGGRTFSSTGVPLLSANSFSTTLTCDTVPVTLPPPPTTTTAAGTSTQTATTAPTVTTPTPSGTLLPISVSPLSTQPQPTTPTPTLDFVPQIVTSPIVIVSDNGIIFFNKSLTVQLNNHSADPNGQVQVQGCANLQGSLEIQLVQEPQFNTTVPLVSSSTNCLNGSFTSVKISANYTDLANRTVTCVPEYKTVQTSTSFSVVFIAPKGKGCSTRKSVPKWLLAVICISIILVAVVLVTGFLILRKSGHLTWLVRSRVKTNATGGGTGGGQPSSYVLFKEDPSHGQL